METRQPARKINWYHPELDVLRFFAFLIVFVFHAVGGDLFTTGFPAGAFGVDLFFTLSAYLITEILLREYRVRGTFDIQAFYVRRILRIWPLYYLFLAFSLFVAPRILPNQNFPLRARLLFLVFLGNWQFLYHISVRSVGSLLWSVSLEEQFYLTWPWILRRFMSKMYWVGAGLLLVATSYRAFLVWHGTSANLNDVYWKGTFSHLDPIVIGSLLAIALKGKTPDLTPGLRLVIGLCGVGGLLLAGHLCPPWGSRALAIYPLAAVSCGAILVSALRPIRAARPGGIAHVFAHLGRISYGLYVFHGLFQTICNHHIRILSNRWEQSIAAFAMTVVAAECSYWALEMPFLRLKQKFSRVPSTPLTVTSPAPVAQKAAAE